MSAHSLEQVVGRPAKELGAELKSFLQAGWTTEQLAMLVACIADARDASTDINTALDLVLSGPHVSGVDTLGTMAMVRSLFEEARSDVLVAGYAVYDGRFLFEPLARKMDANSTLHVRLCLDIGRRHTETALGSEIVRRFVAEFRTHHWPWEALPELYYDPRALSETPAERASLHAKCVVVDRRIALVTSANFTPAAQEKNIEAGVVIRYESLAARLAAYFDGLIASGHLQRCHL